MSGRHPLPAKAVNRESSFYFRIYDFPPESVISPKCNHVRPFLDQARHVYSCLGLSDVCIHPPTWVCKPDTLHRIYEMASTAMDGQVPHLYKLGRWGGFCGFKFWVSDSQLELVLLLT